MSAHFSQVGIAHYDQHTPKRPYLVFKLSGGLRRLIVKVWSHDQEYASNSSNPENRFINSHTWFAFGAIQEVEGVYDSPDNELFEFQRNARALSTIQCHKNDWIIGLPASEDDNDSSVQAWLESLADAEGFKIGIFPLAQYSGWVNTVWKMEVEVICGSSVDEPLRTPQMSLQIDDNEPIIQSKRGGSHSACSTHLRQGLLSIGHQAVEATLQDDPHHSDQLGNMGMWLLERFNTTGCFQTLDLGVKLMKLVVENTPKGHPLQIHWLLDFAAGLGIRHEYTGSSSMDDLYDAIKIYEMVVHTAPAEFHVEARIDRGLVLNNLGNFLGRRFAYSMRAEELDQAIEYLEMATGITPKTDPSRGGRLNSLARWLSERLRYKSNMQDNWLN